MNELTAVENLIEYFIKEKNNGCYQVCIHDLIAQLYVAKEMEEEQDREKWYKGWQDAHDMVEHFRQQGITIISNNNEKN